MRDDIGKIAVWGTIDRSTPLYHRIKCFNVGRSIRKIIPKHLTPQTAVMMDVGCGYNADFLGILKPYYNKGIGLDLQVNPGLKEKPGLTFIEGDITRTIRDIPDESVDMIIFSSILEHMEDPADILREARRILTPKGRVFFSCPSWIGKWVLENIVWTRFFDPHNETPGQINSHKMYYTLRDMWPVVIKAGFVSTEVKIWSTNFLCSTVGYAEKSMWQE